MSPFLAVFSLFVVDKDLWDHVGHFIRLIGDGGVGRVDVFVGIAGK